MKVLWLASTYPSLIHRFDGDFIQRHARATAIHCDVEVIHIVKDADGQFTNDITEFLSNDNRLAEKIIYYKPYKTSIKIIDRYLSSIKYKRIYRDTVKKYILLQGKPAFIHVHMAMKAGLTALWLKKKYRIPYILSEHWGGYLDEAKPSIRDYNFFYRYYWKQIITEAGICTFVSHAFREQMLKKYSIKSSYVIPNVVDTDIFFPAEKTQTEKTRFVHISTMIYQKNTEDILKALNLIKDESPVELYLFGPINPSLESMIATLRLQNIVFIKGEVPQQKLSAAIQQSDVLILYSRFETFGCVLIEANACGVPVIVSNLPVFHEIIDEGFNGIFAEGENPTALAEKLRQFILEKNTFDKNRIAELAAEKYNFNKIGGQFFDLYQTLKTKKI